MLIESRQSTALHEPLWRETPPLLQPMEFSLGMNASDVFAHLFSVLKISDFSYAVYDPESSYHDALLQEIAWEKWSGNTDLGKMSDDIFNESRWAISFPPEKEILPDGETEMVFHNMMAVTSKVRWDGNEWHIPMLDFDLKKTEENLNLISNLKLSPGVIFETDRSYHYVGMTLIHGDDWSGWFENVFLPYPDNDVEMSDGYRQVCLDRGYSGVRIKGYGGTLKEMTPKIVGHIL